MPHDVNPELLHQFRWFQKLDEEEAQQAADDISAQSVKKGEVLFKQGEPGNSMFMVLSGTLDIRVSLPNGQSHTLSTLEAGSIFGEMSLLLEQPRNATAVAVTDAEVCCISHADFIESLEEDETWARKFLMSIARSLAKRISVLDADLVRMVGQEQAKPAPEARTDELERLRTRLLTDWNF